MAKHPWKRPVKIDGILEIAYATSIMVILLSTKDMVQRRLRLYPTASSGEPEAKYQRLLTLSTLTHPEKPTCDSFLSPVAKPHSSTRTS